MNAIRDDISIINDSGIIIQTTFKKDMYVNLFQTDPKQKAILLEIFNGKQFTGKQFTIDTSTKKLKKYTYQPTLDGKYIVKIVMYSRQADSIVNIIKLRLISIAQKHKEIKSVDIFTGEDKIFSIYNKSATINDDHKPLISDIYKKESSRIITEYENGKEIRYEYIYLDRINTNSDQNSAIRIVSDLSIENAILRTELIQSIVLSAIIIIVGFIILFINSRKLTTSVRNLTKNVLQIADGNYNIKADNKGNSEISKLSQNFNIMVEQLNIKLERNQQQKKKMQLCVDKLSNTNNEFEMLSMVASQASNSIMITDANGNFEWVNNSFTKMFGFTLEQLKKERNNNIINNSTTEHIKETIYHCIEAQIAVNYEHQVTLQNGKQALIHVTLTPILDDKGNINKLIAINSDISR